MHWRERMEELLVAEATESLSREDRAELETLLEAHPDTDRYLFQRAAGAVFLSVANDLSAAVPADLYERLLANSEELLEPRG